MPLSVTITDMISSLIERQAAEIIKLDESADSILLLKDCELLNTFVGDLKYTVLIAVESLHSGSFCRRQTDFAVRIGKSLREVAEFQSEEVSLTPVSYELSACELVESACDRFTGHRDTGLHL